MISGYRSARYVYLGTGVQGMYDIWVQVWATDMHGI